MKKYTAGLYMRLSKDDGNNESSSIGNQRKILRAFSKEKCFEIYDEYIDDGYSGTNFERPEFKRMIEDIENKKINLVITKDLSRLGRDYITTGQYTEIYFPGKGVRYIAINDGYDSEGPYGDIAPFKNVVNEMYARDISRKIRSSLLIRMKDGHYIGNFAPYGYEKDKDNKSHLKVDKAVSEVLRAIFCLAANGCTPGKIAEFLNETGISSPIVYRCKKYGIELKNYAECKKHIWTSATVRKILKNEVYIGNTVQHKTSKLSFKVKASLRIPQNEWIKVENTHEPIIDKNTFESAQNQLAVRNTKTTHGNGHRM